MHCVMASELARLNVLERGATALLGPPAALSSRLWRRAGAPCPRHCRDSHDGTQRRPDGGQPGAPEASGDDTQRPGGQRAEQAALTRTARPALSSIWAVAQRIFADKGLACRYCPAKHRIGDWRTQIEGRVHGYIRAGRRQHAASTGSAIIGTPRSAAVRGGGALRTSSTHQLLREERVHSHPLHELLYLVRQPSDVSRYTERTGYAALGQPSCCWKSEKAAPTYQLQSERLEAEGIVMRCITPTDICTSGDYAYDRVSVELAARYFMRQLRYDGDDEEYRQAFADRVYDIPPPLYESIVPAADGQIPIWAKGPGRPAPQPDYAQLDRRNERGRAPFRQSDEPVGTVASASTLFIPAWTWAEYALRRFHRLWVMPCCCGGGEHIALAIISAAIHGHRELYLHSGQPHSV